MTGINFTLTVQGTLTGIVLAGMLWLPFAATAKPRRPGLRWSAAPIAALLFLAGVFAVQAPLQTLLGGWLLQSLSPLTLAAWPILLALPIALTAGLVQEAARLLGTLAALWASRTGARSDAVWTGALAGAGIGLAEAVWLLGAIAPEHFWLFGPAVLERLCAVAFHIGAGALLGYGVAVRRTAAAFGLAVLLHAAADSAAALYQLGHATDAEVLWIAGVIGIGLYLAMLRVQRRAGHSLGLQA